MTAFWIQSGATERVEAFVLDRFDRPLTGKTDIKIAIRRVSDDRWLDFNDNTFKAAGWVTRQLSMSELDATKSAGIYIHNFNTTGFPSDMYCIRIEQVPQSDYLDILEEHLKVGGYPDFIDSALSVIDTNVDTLVARLTAARAAALDLLPGIDVNVTLIKKIMVNRLEMASGSIGNWILYDDDDITPLLTFNVSDVNGLPILLRPAAPARRTRGV